MEINSIEAKGQINSTFASFTGQMENLSTEGVLDYGDMSHLPDAIKTLNQTNENLQHHLNELLLSYGLKADAANIHIMEALMDHQLSLEKPNLIKLNQFMKLIQFIEPGTDLLSGTNEPSNANSLVLNNTSLDKALFYLENQIAPNEANLEVLNHLLNETGSFITGLEQMEGQINHLDDPAIKEQLAHIFNQESTENIQKQADTPLAEPKPPSMETYIFEEETPEALIKVFVKAYETSVLKDQTKDMPDHEAEIKSEIAPETDNKNAQTEDNTQVKTNYKELIQSAIFSKKTLLPGELKQLLHEFPEMNEKEKDAFFKNAVKLSEKNKDHPISLKSKYTIDPKNMNEKDIQELFKDLKQKLVKAEELLTKNNPTEPILKEITTLKESLDFYSDLKNCIYIPLPLSLNGHHASGDLYIFKDGRHKKDGQSISAFISLNTVNMGKVEAYVQKLDKTLNLQFKTDSKEAEKIIKVESQKLHALLSEKKYTIGSFSVLPMDKPFNVLEKENTSQNINLKQPHSFDKKA